MPEPAAPAKAAYEQPTDSTACKRVRALPQSPPFTIVLRTGKRNGNVSEFKLVYITVRA
jgi:hypothetical protein